MQKVLLLQKEDTSKVNILNGIADSYLANSDYKRALPFSEKALALAKKINFIKGLGNSYFKIGVIYTSELNYIEALKYLFFAVDANLQTGNKVSIGEAYYQIATVYGVIYNPPEAIKYCYTALKFFGEAGKKESVATCYNFLGALYNDQGNYSEALKNAFSALKIHKQLGDKNAIANISSNIGYIYFTEDHYAEALENYLPAIKILEELAKNPSTNYSSSWYNYGLSWNRQGVGDTYERLGELAYTKGQKVIAKNYFLKANSILLMALKGYLSMPTKTNSDSVNYKSSLASVYGDLGLLNTKIEKYVVAKNYLQKALQLSNESHNVFASKETYRILCILDSTQGDFSQAFEHYKMFIFYRDNVTNEDYRKKISQTNMQYEFDKKQSAAKAVQDKKDANAKRIKNQQYFVIATLVILVLVILLIAFMQWRNNRHKQKANSLLQQQKEKVESTLSELKSAQAQLIQSEKMASLGELTAGIAHEIQNPLNFVNNFSEVNKELLVEMKGEMNKGNIDDANAIANDVIDNEEKIIHHGKRADAIVKGMLQHSRTSSSQKEPTDINKLADEYLRLSYHGLRAKDKTFNATLQTSFDESIEKINIISQDIGRVLLNLYNNAFYAVTEKSKSQTENYTPIVSVSTKKISDKVEIRVKDNGNGIPKKIIDKIFQPFFTTKPTGQGTGLGLSLSYDIIKAHGGEINVETTEGEGTEFIIVLPSNNV